MKCPNCGYDIPEGHLLCEKCGCEIKIVPDFEIDVENSISETLSTIVDDISPDDGKNEGKEADKDMALSKEQMMEEEFFKEPAFLRSQKPSQRGLAFLLLGGTAFLALVAFLMLALYTAFSVDYQIRKADRFIEKGQYDKAIAYIDKGISIDSKDSALYLSKAKILFAKGDVEGALKIVNDYIDNKNLDQQTLVDFYGLFIEIYEKEGDYDLINHRLLACTDENVRNEFNSYMAMAPVFSIPTGNYPGGTMLSIQSNTQGTIFYTTDGSQPSKDHGNVYSAPIMLEKGEYDIRAVFVNANDTVSETSNSYYLIDLTPPDAPIVNPESGDYGSPVVISAFSGKVTDSIYYTLDGTDPDEENGILYTEPFKAPIGKTNICFVSISEDGIRSEIVRRSYDFELKANVNASEASIYLLNNLYLKGKIADRSGRSLDQNGTYSYVYDSLVEISGNGYYYILVEFYTGENNKRSMTGFMYAVDPYTGESYYFLADEQGNMSLLPI